VCYDAFTHATRATGDREREGERADADSKEQRAESGKQRGIYIERDKEREGEKGIESEREREA